MGAVFKHFDVEISLEIENIAQKLGTNKILLNDSKTFYLISQNKIEKTLKIGDIFEIDGKKCQIITDFSTGEKSLSSDILFVFGTSPSFLNTEAVLNSSLVNISKNSSKFCVFVNNATCHDNLIFSGGSRVYDNKGDICICAKYFDEDVLEFDFDEFKNQQKIPAINPDYKKFDVMQSAFTLDYSLDIERVYKATIFSIKEYFRKNGFTRAVLGLSGGLDSSVCAVLLADSLGNENVLGISMPSLISSSASVSDAKQLSENLKIQFKTVPIKNMVDSFSSVLDKDFSDLPFEKYEKSFTIDNLQARSRAMILWGYANNFKGFLPISTCDKSEDFVGYSTVNGDMSGAFAPLCDITKTKTFALARFINEMAGYERIPQAIIDKKPTAELEIKNGDFVFAEDVLMPYEFMDELIWYFENHNFDLEILMQTTFLYEKNFKISCEQKEIWIKRFFSRLKNARYKQIISPLGPLTDSKSIARDYKALISQKI